jgi:hypothetical protein
LLLLSRPEGINADTALTNAQHGATRG